MDYYAVKYQELLDRVKDRRPECHTLYRTWHEGMLDLLKEIEGKLSHDGESWCVELTMTDELPYEATIKHECPLAAIGIAFLQHDDAMNKSIQEKENG